MKEYGKLKIKEGVLYRKTKEEERDKLQLVLPFSLTKDVSIIWFTQHIRSPKGEIEQYYCYRKGCVGLVWHLFSISFIILKQMTIIFIKMYIYNWLKCMWNLNLEISIYKLRFFYKHNEQKFQTNLIIVHVLTIYGLENDLYTQMSRWQTWTFFSWEYYMSIKYGRFPVTKKMRDPLS